MTEIGLAVEELDTPCVIIDLDKMKANIDRVVGFATQHGVKYRPHTKTHKIPAIAHLQLAAGASGITVARPGEAEVMAAAGIDDIFIAHIVVGAGKIRRMAALARRVRLAVGVDNLDQARMLSQVFRYEAAPLDVMIEIDTGHLRAGVQPPAAPALAAQIARLPGLRVRGIFTHEGHDYYARSLDELATIAANAQQQMVTAGRQVSEVLGYRCWVSIGSTPSLASHVLLEGIDEIRPGTCVFYDAAQAGVLGHTDWCAATVMATVISTPAADRAVVDAGSKTLTSDRREGESLLATRGYGIIVGHPDLEIARLSEEHGVIVGAGAGHRFKVGDRVRIIPNHICTVINLRDHVYGVRDGRVEVIWEVAARGRSQ